MEHSVDIITRYKSWLSKATDDADIVDELQQMAHNDAWIEDAFYKNLAFGTGGLRGVIGAGTNRMNIYTIAKATQGLANYVIKCYTKAQRSIAISFDSRIKSDVFAKVAAEVFCANGIQVYLYNRLMPTPCLSFAVRYLQCVAGVMITASHNPAKYNGYKVYSADGCQITTEAASKILCEIEALDIFSDIQRHSYEEGVQDGLICSISDDVTTAYIDAVKGQTLIDTRTNIDKTASIIYTPLNGAGLQPILRVLHEMGYHHVRVVPEQAEPDGMFPTCPFPNPEIREALDLGIAYAKANRADLLIASDPDCDRVGIAVKNQDDFTLLSGNETGMLLLDYICTRRVAMEQMPANPVMVKTIVTIDMAERIAANYGVQTINVLTGFKFIGEQIGLLEKANRKNDFIFGFEESYGYLSGTYVRDKDAVNATLLICEMFVYYQTHGITLLDRLSELYHVFGYCHNTLHTYTFEGSTGLDKMQQIMQRFRGNIRQFGTFRVVSCFDYKEGLNGLPKADVLKFYLESNCSIVLRPSGTEPKLKAYLSITFPSKAEATATEQQLLAYLQPFFQDI